jgi:hypothetical protein
MTMPAMQLPPIQGPGARVYRCFGCDHLTWVEWLPTPSAQTGDAPSVQQQQQQQQPRPRPKDDPADRS